MQGNASYRWREGWRCLSSGPHICGNHVTLVLPIAVLSVLVLPFNEVMWHISCLHTRLYWSCTRSFCMCFSLYIKYVIQTMFLVSNVSRCASNFCTSNDSFWTPWPIIKCEYFLFSWFVILTNWCLSDLYLNDCFKSMFSHDHVQEIPLCEKSKMLIWWSSHWKNAVNGNILHFFGLCTIFPDGLRIADGEIKDDGTMMESLWLDWAGLTVPGTICGVELCNVHPWK